MRIKMTKIKFTQDFDTTKSKQTRITNFFKYKRKPSTDSEFMDEENVDKELTVTFKLIPQSVEDSDDDIILIASSKSSNFNRSKRESTSNNTKLKRHSKPTSISNISNNSNLQSTDKCNSMSSKRLKVSRRRKYSKETITVGRNDPTISKDSYETPKMDKQTRIITRDKNENIAHSTAYDLSQEFISTDFNSELFMNSQSTIDTNNCLNESVQQNVHNYGTPKTIKVLENIVLQGSSKNNVAVKNSCTSFISSSTPKGSPNNSPKKTIYSPLKTNNESEIAKENNWKPFSLRLILKIIKYIFSHNNLKLLLNTQEMDVLNQFIELPNEDYIFFCMRLYTRIKKWYNVFKLTSVLNLEMPESSVIQMYDCLTKMGFVDNNFILEPCELLLNHLLQKDIKDVCNSFKLKTDGKKSDMIQRLLINCNSQSTLTSCKTTEHILKERIKEKMGYCVKLNSDFYNILNKVHLLYSFTLNEFHSTSDLYLFLSKIENTSIILPKYQINTDVQIFSSIGMFSSFAAASECKRALEQAQSKQQFNDIFDQCVIAHTKLTGILERNVEISRPSYLMRFTDGYKYAKALSLGCKCLMKHFPLKVEEWLKFLLKQSYCQQLRGRWYDNLILLKRKYLKQHANAFEILIEALKDENLSIIDKYDLNTRAETFKRSRVYKITNLQRDNISYLQPHCIEKFPSIEVNARAIHSYQIGKKRNYMEKSEHGQHILTVEEIALNDYFKNGYKNGKHCEGALLITLFFVLFWDIIYESDVPYAFITEVQYVPLDLLSKEFYANRKDAIDTRLNEIKFEWSHDHISNVICDIWKAHSHEKSYITDIIVESPKQLYEILLCIGRTKLSKILGRIVKDFKMYKSGLPDLFVWDIDEKKCKFVEVKGEHDKLSSRQRLWLDFLRSVGADIEVCHVHTMGSKSSLKFTKTN